MENLLSFYMHADPGVVFFFGWIILTAKPFQDLNFILQQLNGNLIDHMYTLAILFRMGRGKKLGSKYENIKKKTLLLFF